MYLFETCEGQPIKKTAHYVGAGKNGFYFGPQIDPPQIDPNWLKYWLNLNVA